METVGLIPSAGRGTRLGLPFSKEMFPDVRNQSYRPIINYTIDAMKQAGIRHLIFTVNPRKTDLLRFLGNGSQFGMNFTYCIHPEPKSLPESLDEAYHLTFDKRVVLAMPDTVIQPASFARELLAAHQQGDPLMTFGCFRTVNPTKFGMVDIKEGHVRSIVDKPQSSELTWMWGTIAWEPEVTQVLHEWVRAHREHPHDGELILSDAFHTVYARGRAEALCFENGTYRDLGTYNEIIEWGTPCAGAQQPHQEYRVQTATSQYLE